MSLSRTIINQLPSKVGEIIVIKGWVHAWRALGKIRFLDIRDRSGIVQVVFGPDELSAEDFTMAAAARLEWVVEIEGVVQARKSNNSDPLAGVEVSAKRFTVLNKAETTPLEINNDERLANEEMRLKYRYLDLRRFKMQQNIKLRHEVVKFIREWFYARDFWEIETPYLGKSTPEGARDFLVPSRKDQGKFYALPQSPQQYKQLLMVGGMEKYFQIVRCFRDEDQRGDRQSEFTQLDTEMSFVSQEDILNMIEELMVELVKTVAPHLKISQLPFPRFTYQQAMEQYKSDRPDLRQNKENPQELAFAWVTDFPMFEHMTDDSWSAMHHPFTAVQNPADLDHAPSKDILAQQYDLVLNGNEIGGGSIREHNPQNLQRVFEALGHSSSAVQQQFGHLLEAFKYGVPPHGGIALGLERLIMILAGEPSIREVIAFPKTLDGHDLTMGAPSTVTKDQLDELGLKLK